MQMETIINNTGGSTLNLYTGDYTSGGGQSEVVAPGLGFGESAIRIGGDPAHGDLPFTFLGWFGFGESDGLSYGLIPQVYAFTSSFTASSERS